MKTLVPFNQIIQQAPTVGPDWPVDGDGILIPPDVAHNWHRFTPPMRRKTSEIRVDRWHKEQAQLAKPVRVKQVQTGDHSEYTTKAATKWARSLGLAILAKERFGATMVKGQVKFRREDLRFKSDLICEDRAGQTVYIQAAGRGERKTHREGYEDTLFKTSYTPRVFIFVEFVRGVDRPVKIEFWAGSHTDVCLPTREEWWS